MSNENSPQSSVYHRQRQQKNHACTCRRTVNEMSPEKVLSMLFIVEVDRDCKLMIHSYISFRMKLDTAQEYFY